MLSPQDYSEKTGLSYQQVLLMCKSGELKAIKTKGGHFKIRESEVDNKQDYVSKEEYMKVVRENERLKTILEQMKAYVASL